jgi:lipopolysaccharide export system permease protein
MTLPTGMSLAASLALSRLTRESELTAMRAAGARVLRVIVPVMVFGLLVGVGNFLLVEKVMPPAEKQFNRLMTQFAMVESTPVFQSNAVVRLKDMVVTVGTVAREPNDVIKLTDVIIIQRPKLHEVQVTSADAGEYRNGIWHLRNTLVRYFIGQDMVTFQAGKDAVINQPIAIGDLFSAASAPEELTSAELMKEIREGKARGGDMRLQEMSLHVRFSVPAACIVFALVAPIFAVWFARSGGFVGVLLSIFLVFLYYNAYVISTEVFGKNGWVSPFVAAWLPNFLFIVLGLIGIRRLE